MVETKNTYFCKHAKLSIKNINSPCPLRLNQDQIGCFACNYLSSQPLKTTVEIPYEYENPDFLEIV